MKNSQVCLQYISNFVDQTLCLPAKREVTYTWAKSPMISTVGVFIPLYFGRFGNSSKSPKLTRPGDLWM